MMISMEEKKVLRKKNALRSVKQLRLWQAALAGRFDDLTDEEFALKLDIIPSNRKAFIKWLQEDPVQTQEGVKELINFYIVGELSSQDFLQKLSALEFVESYFEDADDLYPEDYHAGTLDILRRERRGFQTFDNKTWEEILKISESKNIPVYPIDREKKIENIDKKIAV